MTRLFVLDIDGCLTVPFTTPHWESFTKIRSLNILAKTDSRIPKLAILTGRPQPYAEAVAQMLDIDKPVVFESGGGMFDPVTTQVRFNPAITASMMARVARMKTWAQTLLESRFPTAMVEFAKHTDVGFVSQEGSVIGEIYRLCRERAACEEDLFEVHQTEISVNVILKVCNKGEGLKWISEETGIPLGEIAYIGDSSGDLTALRLAGRAFAPSNATAAVKAVAEVVPHPTSEAVLAAYRMMVIK